MAMVTISPVEEAEAARLVASGYFPISNRHRILARIDRADWQVRMAARHAPWSRAEGEGWVGALGHGAGDQYRRVYSTDRVTVSAGVFAAVKALSRRAGPGTAEEYIAGVGEDGPSAPAP